MKLRLPSGLHYPITITSVSKQVDDVVNLKDVLFHYNYESYVLEGERHSDVQVRKKRTFAATFESTLEGTISKWLVWEKDTLTGPVEVLDMEEACKHAVQFDFLCADCGKDMKAGDGAGVQRAQVQIAHDTDKLKISAEEASEADERSKKRLLASRKLSLIVDLDQTIIHAAVDSTIPEWQADPDNPNYEALQDVRRFLLKDEGPGNRATWYYVKLRPGLADFLESVSEHYELHIYTMGTRGYAMEIAKLIDPEQKYFGDRILSRDESGSMVKKSMARIFPVDSRMVVIIDDRGDVWNHIQNLLRVSVYDFFVGIGDINASFLPKKQEIRANIKAKPVEAKAIAEEANGFDVHKTEEQNHFNGAGDLTPDTTALETLVAMSDSTGSSSPELQAKAQEETIIKQLEDKPLLKLQQKMDEKDEAASNEPATQATDSDSDSSESSQSKPKARHSILNNDDEELIYLDRSLRAIHDKFFAEYDRKRLSGKSGRVAALSGRHNPPPPQREDNPTVDLKAVPDVARIMPAMKARVLDGTTIVFSGVLPLGTDIQTADISQWAKSFGAKVTDKVTRDVTHVIAARVGTAKVKTAVKRNIKVVGTDWLMTSIQRWKKQDERPYLLPGIGQKEIDRDASSEIGAQDLLDKDTNHFEYTMSSSDADSSAFGDTDNDTDNSASRRKRLKVDTTRANGEADDDAEDEEEIDGNSPISINADVWGDMDAEVRDLLGSDMDSESDAESIRSERSTSLAHRDKRKRPREDTDDEGEGGNTNNDRDLEARPQKTLKGSSLKAVANANATAKPVAKTDEGFMDDDDDALDTEDEFAKELEKELEAEDAAANS